jgi:hypothetical protein
MRKLGYPGTHVEKGGGKGEGIRSKKGSFTTKEKAPLTILGKNPQGIACRVRTIDRVKELPRPVAQKGHQ